MSGGSALYAAKTSGAQHKDAAAQPQIVHDLLNPQ